MKLINICNRVIEFSFYALFLLVPLVLAGDTSELFEFNKMWFAFSLGIVIAAAWGVKSLLSGGIKIQRTPLDIPIILFLASQIVSTIFSLDQHVSIWGYYSRFNGGLLSTTLYIFLYYAFVSNLLKKEKDEGKSFNAKIVKRILNISLVSGIIVSLWGIPSHFGYDPTCFLFRGNFDVSCWAEDFQPKVRIFSTLGQPDWLSAYMAILIPVSAALFLEKVKGNLKPLFSKVNIPALFYFISFILFTVSLLYSGSRSGFLAVSLALVILLLGYFFLNRKKINLIAPAILIFTTVVFTFFIGAPFGILNKISYGGLKTALAPPPPSSQPKVEKPAPQHSGELGGTDSSKIRLIVWRGALNAWKNNPLFGTGVETFAFAYYKYKSADHNLTSEWNFLYNKAHNEFLNYLATTGLFGLGTYIAMMGIFLYQSLKKLLKDGNSGNKLLVLGLIASYITISVTNFFGFSVVIVNIYLFLIPAFVLALEKLINYEKSLVVPRSFKTSSIDLSPFQWVGIIATCLVGIYLLYNLLVFWNADKAFGYGNNLNRAGYYQEAYPYLQKAAMARESEPIYKDELAINNAILATSILSGGNTQNATEASATALKLSQEAISKSTEVISAYPNNFVFWKTRVRIFYTLAQVDPNMLIQALDAVKHAQALAPNDASINYNLGVIQGQSGNIDEAIKVLEATIKLKPDYRDPRYALGLFYYQKAVDKDGKVVDRSYLEKAKSEMKYILNRLGSNDGQAQETLKTLEAK